MPPASAVLALLVRSGFVESVHTGSVCGLDVDGRRAVEWGQPSAPIFPRSSLKPLQAVAMLRAGLALDPEFVALAAASHSGEAIHLQGVRRMLAAGGFGPGDLRCPPSLPLGAAARDEWIRAGR